MTTGARVRASLDYGRLREAMAGPGADPRTWVSMGRVDDDEDAITFDPNPAQDGTGGGWLIDVTLQGGALDQEGSIPCRVSEAFSGDDRGRIEPFERGCEVLVLIPEGDPNASPVIVGQIHNAGDCQVPNQVNGTDIDEALALATHIFVTPHAVDEQIDGTRRVKTGDTHRLLGPLLELADEGASQSFVLGNTQKDALDTFAQSVLSAFTDLVPPGPPATPVTAAQAAAAVITITAAVAQLSADLTGALSDKIKGE